MYHAMHICLGVFACMILLEPGNAEDKPIPGKDFLPISANIEGVLSPNLLKELHDRRPNRTTLAQAISTTTSTTSRPKTPKVTSKPTRKFRTTGAATTTNLSPAKQINDRPELPGLDLARAQQVRQENQYPFDFRNNFNNFPGAGSQRVGRQFDDGQFNGFGDRNPFGSDLQSRQFGSLIDGSRTNENTIPGSNGQNGGNRSPFGNAGASFDFDRFRDFGRFGYDDRFSGRFFDSNFRGQGDRFGFPNFGQQNEQLNNPNNFRQNLRNDYPSNFQQNPLTGDQRSNFQGPQGNFPFGAYAPNSFDFLSSQRFQNAYPDDFLRGQQGGTDFPLFYPSRPVKGASPGAPGNPAASSGTNNSNNDDSEEQPASRRSGEVEKPEGSKNSPTTSTETPQNDPRSPRFVYYPQLDDYSDLRFRPDIFKQYVVHPNFLGNRKNNDDIVG